MTIIVILDELELDKLENQDELDKLDELEELDKLEELNTKGTIQTRGIRHSQTSDKLDILDKLGFTNAHVKRNSSLGSSWGSANIM